jgi:hypothetical protein
MTCEIHYMYYKRSIILVLVGGVGNSSTNFVNV